MFVPYGKGEHAPEVLCTVLTPFGIGSKYNLCIGGSPIRVVTEFLAEFKVIIDLAVIADDMAHTVVHGLFAGLEVDDRQPAVGKTDIPFFMYIESVVIRTTVFLKIVHGPQVPIKIRVGGCAQCIYACYSTHFNFPLLETTIDYNFQLSFRSFPVHPRFHDGDQYFPEKSGEFLKELSR